MARAMMKVQMEHALTRLGEAFDELTGKRPEPRGTLRDEQRAEYVRNGKVKVTPAMMKRAISAHERSASRSRNNRYCDSVEDCIRNELQRAIDKVFKSKPDPVYEAWAKKREKVLAKYNECKDEIILGDVDRALKLIAAFKKTKV